MNPPVHPLRAQIDGKPAGPRTIAAAWFARKRSGDMTEQEGRELAAWLDADPAHRAAWELAGQVWSASDGVRANPTMLSIRERALGRRRFGWAARGGAIAASLALAVFGGWAVMERAPAGPVISTAVATQADLAGAKSRDFTTAVGQRRTLTLEDGTVVTLDTNSAIRAREGGRVRLVELERGQAFFKVAHDRSRPFLVRAAGRTVVATGTEFGVRVDRGRIAVTLIEGSVRVEAPINGAGDGRFSRYVQTTELTPGSRLEARDGQPWAISEVDAERETSWMTDKLVFQDEPLSKVVAELNRYSGRRIVIADPALADDPVSGSFRTDDMDEAVRAIVSYGLARVSAQDGATVKLSSVQGDENKSASGG
jgi:transmembrane sensor